MLVGEVIARFNANMSGFTRGVDQANRQLRQMQGEAQRGSSALKQMFAVAGGMILANGISQAAASLQGFVRQSIDAASRAEEMDLVLGTIGKNAGVTRNELDAQTKSIRSMGIELGVSQQALSQFIKYNLDVAKASQLARVAQDAAVISASNSSETLDRLIWGITTRQTEILRTAGITVNFERAYSNMAREMGKSVSSLTEAEKTQAALNAVLSEGATITGAYESAMESAGKQLRSTPRYINDLQIAVGQTLMPLFSIWVHSLNEAIKLVTHLFRPEGALSKAIKQFSFDTALKLKGAFDSVKATVEDFRLGHFVREFDKLKGSVEEARPLIIGIGVAIAKSILPIGQALGPLGFLATIFGTIVLSSKPLRDAFLGLGKNVVEAAASIGQALIPVMNAVMNAVNSATPAIVKLVEAFGDSITTIAKLAAVIITALVPAVEVIAGVLTTLLNVLTANKAVAMAFATVIIGVWVLSLTKGISVVRAAVVAYDALKGAMLAAAAASRTSGAVIGMGGGLSGGIGAGISSLAASVGPVNAAVGAVVLTIAAAAYQYHALRQEAEQAQERVSGVWDAMARTQGADVAMRRLSERTRELRGNLEAARDAAAANASPSIWQQGLRALRIGNQQGAPTHVSSVPGVRVGSERQPITSEGRDGPSSERVAEARLARHVQAMKEIWNSYKDDTLSAMNEVIANYDKDASERDQSVAQLQASLGVASSATLNYANMTTTELKNLEEQVNDTLQKTQEWAKNMTSFSGALKAAEERDGMDLFAYYKEQGTKLAYFWENIKKMQFLGAGTDIIQDLVAAGPQAVGDQLNKFIDHLGTMSTDAAAQAVNAIDSISTAMQQYSDEQARAIIENQIQNSGNLGSRTQEQLIQIATDYQNLQSQLQDARSNVGIILQGLNQNLDEASGPAAEAGRRYAAAVQTFMDTLNNAAATASERRAAFVNALQLGTAFADQADAGGQQLQATLQSYLDTMFNATRESRRLGRLMGINTATGIMEGTPAARAAAIEQVQAILDVLASAINALRMVRRAIRNIGDTGGITATVQNLRGVQDQMQALNDYATASSGATSMIADLADQSYPAVADSASQAAAATRDLGQETQQTAQEAYDAVDKFAALQEAFQNQWGYMMDAQKGTISYRNSLSNLSTALQTYSEGPKNNAAANDTLSSSVLDTISALKDQAMALYQSGKLGYSFTGVLAYMNNQLDSLGSSLPKIAENMLRAAEAAKPLEERLGDIGKLLDDNLNKFTDATKARWNSDSAVKDLKRAVDVQKALLSNPGLAKDDQRDIRRQTRGQLMDVVAGLQQEAMAAAKAGKIKGDAASITKFLTRRLKELQNQFPSLSGEIQKYIKRLKGVPKDAETKFKVDATRAMELIQQYKEALKRIPTETNHIIRTQIDQALLNSSIAQAQAQLFGYLGNVNTAISPYTSFLTTASTIQFAEGGVHKEDHTAHVARTQRVFAEPETGGEAYIPLSKNKRTRSVDILKYVAKEFGLDLIPSVKTIDRGKFENYVANAQAVAGSGGHVQHFANGGINMAQWDSTSQVRRWKRAVGIPELGAEGVGKQALDVAKYLSMLTGTDPTSYARAVRFAEAQMGKPYKWGGVGPEGYDCSGLWSAIVNTLEGSFPHSRLFTSGTLTSAAATGMPGKHIFPGIGGLNAISIGSRKGNPGHVSGNIGKTAYEATGDYLRKNPGGNARYASDPLFQARFHYSKYDSGGILKPGITIAENRTGKNEYVTKDNPADRKGDLIVEGDLVIQSNDPPKKWFEEAVWRTRRESGL